MKKFAILLGLVATVMVVAGCASKGTTDQPSKTFAAPSHHDLKGEAVSTK